MVQLAAETYQSPHQEKSKVEIGDYAMVGDCRTAALVSLHGSIDWLCLPHFSGASVFAALLDEERGGRFLICPVGQFQSTRRYLGATAVLETTFKTITGSARLVDAMPIVEDARTLRPLRELLRFVEGIEGEVSFDVRWEPRPNYARVVASIKPRGALGWSCAWSDELFLLHSEAALELKAHEKAVVGRIHVEAGRKYRFSLGYAKADIGVISPLGQEADDRMRSTLEWWQSWSSQCALMDHTPTW